MLRNGVEYSLKHSFIACIANLFSEYNNNKIENIDNMKKIIIDAIDIDFFAKLNNFVVPNFISSAAFPNISLNPSSTYSISSKKNSILGINFSTPNDENRLLYGH